jgi:hypothetical protein
MVTENALAGAARNPHRFKFSRCFSFCSPWRQNSPLSFQNAKTLIKWIMAIGGRPGKSKKRCRGRALVSRTAPGRSSQRQAKSGDLTVTERFLLQPVTGRSPQQTRITTCSPKEISDTKHKPLSPLNGERGLFPTLQNHFKEPTQQLAVRGICITCSGSYWVFQPVGAGQFCTDKNPPPLSLFCTRDAKRIKCNVAGKKRIHRLVGWQMHSGRAHLEGDAWLNHFPSLNTVQPPKAQNHAIMRNSQ